jgi:hypothetical protein
MRDRLKLKKGGQGSFRNELFYNGYENLIQMPN